jgi:hypothetical protein
MIMQNDDALAEWIEARLAHVEKTLLFDINAFLSTESRYVVEELMLLRAQLKAMARGEAAVADCQENYRNGRSL